MGVLKINSIFHFNAFMSIFTPPLKLVCRKPDLNCGYSTQRHRIDHLQQLSVLGEIQEAQHCQCWAATIQIFRICYLDNKGQLLQLGLGDFSSGSKPTSRIGMNAGSTSQPMTKFTNRLWNLLPFRRFLVLVVLVLVPICHCSGGSGWKLDLKL